MYHTEDQNYSNGSIVSLFPVRNNLDAGFVNELRNFITACIGRMHAAAAPRGLDARGLLRYSVGRKVVLV